MAVFEMSYPARCKHCDFIEEVYKGKLTRHRCMLSKEQVRVRDFACSCFILDGTIGWWRYTPEKRKEILNEYRNKKNAQD